MKGGNNPAFISPYCLFGAGAASREVQWVMPTSPPAMPNALEVIPGVTVEVGPSTFQEVVSLLTFRVTFTSSTLCTAIPIRSVPWDSASLLSLALLSLHQHLETSGNPGPGCCCCSDKWGWDLLGQAHPEPDNAVWFWGFFFHALRLSLAQAVAAPEFMLGRAVSEQESLRGLGPCPCCLTPALAVSTSVTFPRLLRNSSFILC